MPKPLVTPVTARVGLILDQELLAYHHQETRAGTDWDVELGPATAKMWEDAFKAAFTDARIFNSLEEAIAGGSDLQALAQPRIEQFSFATARETVGGHWAATLRLRLGVFSPTGQPVDSLTHERLRKFLRQWRVEEIAWVLQAALPCAMHPPSSSCRCRDNPSRHAWRPGMSSMHPPRRCSRPTRSKPYRSNPTQAVRPAP